MSDVHLNIGSNDANIEHSKIDIGNVTGGDSINVSTHSRDDLQAAYNQLLLRLVEVEHVLAGQWGQPGLVQNVAIIKEKILEIEESRQDNKILLLSIEREMAKGRQEERLTIEREKRYATVYLVVATLCLALSFGIVLRWF